MIIAIITAEAINQEAKAKTEVTKLELRTMPSMTDDEPQNRRRIRKRKRKRRRKKEK